MTKLSDTQLVILSTAAARPVGAVLPLPDSLRLARRSRQGGRRRFENLFRTLTSEPGCKRVADGTEGSDSERNQSPLKPFIYL